MTGAGGSETTARDRTEQVERTLSARTPGISRAEIELGEYPDGLPIVSPVIVAGGREPGPTLWVQACVHGPEVGGILGIQAFLRDTTLGDLKGKIIFLLVTNPLGFRANQRLTPQDGANLNRAFPGSPDGSPTQQLADKVFRLVTAHADVMLDLHSGGDHAISAHYSIFTAEGSEAGEKSRAIANAIGTPLVWNAPSASLRGAAYVAFTETGKPAVLFESGGGARVTPDDVKNFSHAISRTCQFLEMLPGTAEPAVAIEGRIVRNFQAKRGGIFIANTEPNAIVGPAALLGHIVNVFGDVTETFVNPFSSAVVTATRRPNMAVYSGDDVLSLMCLDGMS